LGVRSVLEKGMVRAGRMVLVGSCSDAVASAQNRRIPPQSEIKNNVNNEAAEEVLRCNLSKPPLVKGILTKALSNILGT
jgi:hypothetical protein